MTTDTRKTNFKIYPPFFVTGSNTNTTITLPSAPVGSILTIGTGGNLSVLTPGTPGQVLTTGGGGTPTYATVPGVVPVPSNVVTTIAVGNATGLDLGAGTLGGARDLNGDIIQTNRAVLNTGINLFASRQGGGNTKDVGVTGDPATSDVFFVHANIVAKSNVTSNPSSTNPIGGTVVGIAYRIQALFKYNPHIPERIEACGEDRLVLEDDSFDLDHLGGPGHGFDATLSVNASGFIVARVTQGNIAGTWTWREDTYAVCI